MRLHFVCPRDGAKFSAVEASSAATQVIRRKCRRCARQYQLVVEPSREAKAGVHFTRATILALEPKVTVIE